MSVTHSPFLLSRLVCHVITAADHKDDGRETPDFCQLSCQYLNYRWTTSRAQQFLPLETSRTTQTDSLALWENQSSMARLRLLSHPRYA